MWSFPWACSLRPICTVTFWIILGLQLIYFQWFSCEIFEHLPSIFGVCVSVAIYIVNACFQSTQWCEWTAGMSCHQVQLGQFDNSRFDFFQSCNCYKNDGTVDVHRSHKHGKMALVCAECEFPCGHWAAELQNVEISAHFAVQECSMMKGHRCRLYTQLTGKMRYWRAWWATVRHVSIQTHCLLRVLYHHWRDKFTE